MILQAAHEDQIDRCIRHVVNPNKKRWIRIKMLKRLKTILQESDAKNAEDICKKAIQGHLLDTMLPRQVEYIGAMCAKVFGDTFDRATLQYEMRPWKDDHVTKLCHSLVDHGLNGRKRWWFRRLCIERHMMIHISLDVHRKGGDVAAFHNVVGCSINDNLLHFQMLCDHNQHSFGRRLENVVHRCMRTYPTLKDHFEIKKYDCFVRLVPIMEPTHNSTMNTTKVSVIDASKRIIETECRSNPINMDRISNPRYVPPSIAAHFKFANGRLVF